MSTLNNLTTLQAFVSLVNYDQIYNSNIYNVRTLVNDLLKKSVNWCWIEEYQKAFDELNKHSNINLSLMQFNLKLDIIFSSDMSGYSVEAIIFSVKKFHRFIRVRSFCLQMDHHPLQSIYGSKKGIRTRAVNRAP